MGSEAKCTVAAGGRTGAGTALLETDALVFRGDFTLRIPLRAVKRAWADGGVLVVESADGAAARFDVGRVAARWAAKITSPPSRLDKLGVKEGARVAVVGELDDDFVAELGARARVVRRGAGIVLFAASARAALARVPALRRALPDDGALWIVYPKGRTEIREADVLAAGRAAGLKDVKVARFSETHTALRFVVPVVRRRTPRAS